MKEHQHKELTQGDLILSQDQFQTMKQEQHMDAAQTLLKYTEATRYVPQNILNTNIIFKIF